MKERKLAEIAVDIFSSQDTKHTGEPIYYLFQMHKVL